MEFIEKIIDDLDEEFLEDFLDSIYNEQAFIEQNLMNIHRATNANERLQSLLTPLQKIKMICRLGFLDPLVSYVQVTEDLIEAVIDNRLDISEKLAEFLLLIFDELRAASEDLVQRQTLDTELLKTFHDKIRNLIDNEEIDQADEIHKLIAQFTPRIRADLVFKAFETSLYNQEVKEVELDDDLEVFKSLADFLDNRCKYWESRTEKILHMSLLINNALDNPVDRHQLTAAVYMHDVAMGFLPDQLLMKNGRYDSIDIMLLQQHPSQCYEILTRMPPWREAADIVYQHHERYDCNGYPNGISGDKIHLGAKIIAVADSYYALTTARADRQFKKSSLRAVSEINRCNGTQFDPLVVSTFNDMFSQSLAKNL